MTPKQKIEHAHNLKICKLLGIKAKPSYSTVHLRSLIEHYKQEVYTQLGIEQPNGLDQIT